MNFRSIRRLTIVILVVYIIAAYIPVFGESGSEPSNDRVYRLGDAVFSPSDEVFDLNAGTDSISFTDSTLKVSVDISVNDVDVQTIQLLRGIYKDDSSSDIEMINELAVYKISLLDTLSEKSRVAHLYGYSQDGSDSAIKIFAKRAEVIYGLKAQSAIFNVLESGKDGIREYTCIAMELPDPHGSAIYSFAFRLEKGSLDDSTIQSINRIINEFKIRNQSFREQKLSIFFDQNINDQANRGMFSDINYSGKIYGFSNPDFGYFISLPASLVPFRYNIVSNTADYRSWELGVNRIISITSEAVSIPEIENSSIQKNASSTVRSIETGDRKINDKEYKFSYTLEKRNGAYIYRQAYITSKAGFKYTIALESNEIISAEETEFMIKLLDNFIYMSNAPQSDKTTIKKNQFINREEGYTFDYPSSWKVEESVASDVYYEAFTVKNPEISGTIDINVSEGELAFGKSASAAASELASLGELTTGTFIKYRVPYSGNTVRLLSSIVAEHNGATVVERQINYIDANDEGRMCYVKDIIMGSRVVTLVISVADYAANVDGKILSPEVDKSLNMIIDSFKFIPAPEYKARLTAGENRCRKIVFLENFLKENVGSSVIRSVTGPGNSGKVMVAAGTGSGKGFYTIRIDSSASRAEIVSKVLNNDIVKNNKAYLDKILSIRPVYSYPSAEGIFLYNSKDSISYRSYLYILGSGLSAYISMEYRPDKEENEILALTPPVSLLPQVEQLYRNSGYSVINCQPDNNDPFTLNVFLQSKKDGTVKQERKRVAFNMEKLVFDIR